MTRTAIIITSVIATICIVFFTMLGVLSAKEVSMMPFGEQVTIGGMDKTSDKVGMINFLLIGVDEDGTRSDTIMLICHDGYSNRTNILSFPRDTKVKINGYSQKLNAAIGAGIQKVEAGKDKAPEEELIRQIKAMSGLPIHYFVTIDFDGFKEVIDALDGVEFNIPYNMNYDDPVQDLHIHLKKGQQHLDGQMAHDFVRYRHNNDGSAPGEYAMGDEGRIYWQQRFVKALIEQKAKPQYFSKITDIFEVISNNVRTNYSLQDLLMHVDTIKNININEIQTYKLPGEAYYDEGYGTWWYRNDEEKTGQLIKEVFLPRSKEQWEEEKAAKEAELLAESNASTEE